MFVTMEAQYSSFNHITNHLCMIELSKSAVNNIAESSTVQPEHKKAMGGNLALDIPRCVAFIWCGLDVAIYFHVY